MARSSPRNPPALSIDSRVRLAYWAVVKTKKGSERWARINIERQGHKAFIPYIKRGRSPKLEPLFPGYLFVWIDGPWSYLRSTYGVSGVIIIRGRPHPVREKEMQELLNACGVQGFIDISPPFLEQADLKIDQHIKIGKGLFKDHIARYIGSDADSNIRAMLSIFGKDTEVILGKYDALPP